MPRLRECVHWTTPKAFIYAGFSPSANSTMRTSDARFGKAGLLCTKPHCNKCTIIYRARQPRGGCREGASGPRKIFFADTPDRSVLRRFCEDLREMRGSLGGASEPEFSAARVSATVRNVPGRRRFLFPSRTRATRFRIADIPRRAQIRRRYFPEQAARRCRAPAVAG